MYKIIFTVIFVTNLAQTLVISRPKRVEKDEGKSSLVFVFDTTGSMYNDLKQLRQGAEMILKTALEESNVIADFVFVPFHDPVVGPATVTRNKYKFQAALNIVRVYGGGDCPEKSLGGIQMALNVSRPRSFVYVFTDATASDHRLVGKILDAVQRKQSQVVFVLTGHCNDLKKPSYKVYQQIAAASSGQVFNLNKTNVHKVLEFVRSSIRGRSVNLGSAVHPAGYNTQEIPVDSTLGEVTVSVSGAKPKIKVVNPSGEQLVGPPKLVTTLDLSEIMIVKVLQPEPGNWTITVGSEKDYSVKVSGLSNVTFNHGFSVEKPKSIEEASYRPLQGTYNHMLLSLTQTDIPILIKFAEILSMDGKTLFEIPVERLEGNGSVYVTNAFVPPNDFFYIAINGRHQYGQELRRIGATAVQAKPPDVPYLTAPVQVQARSHERVVLNCYAESLVPVSVKWTKDSSQQQRQTSSLQSTSLEYVIEDMDEEHAGTYRCSANNVAGQSVATTEVYMLVDPPQVTVLPLNTSLSVGDELTVSCTVFSEALLTNCQIVFTNNGTVNVTEVTVRPSMDGYHTYNKTVAHVTESDEGVYTCVAVNRGGRNNQSAYITIESEPTAQIIGPHTLTRPLHGSVQLVCHVDNADAVQWVGPNGSTVSETVVNGNHTSMLDVNDVLEDGAWVCVSLRKLHRASDSVQLNVIIKPNVSIVGEKNITIVNGTIHQVVCNVVAKPEPRILWHKETENFLNTTVTQLEPNLYRSVLSLDSAKEEVNGTYFCFGENSAGIDQDSITVNVRRKMVLIEGFSDQSVELYSQLDLHCEVDAQPPANITWLHNGTSLQVHHNTNLSENRYIVYIQKVEFEDLGLYSCVADNGYETIEVNGTIQVHGLEGPVLLKEPAKITVQRGKPAVISCRVIKGNPVPKVTWKYSRNNSENFSETTNFVANDDRYEILVDSSRVSNSGSYRCVVDNVVGEDIYDVELVVQYPPELSILSGPKIHEQLEVEAGSKVTLSCNATGIPPPIVVWTKDNKPVSYSKNVYLTDENNLVIENATVYHSGQISCNATSVLGSVTRNFTLEVFTYVGCPTGHPVGRSSYGWRDMIEDDFRNLQVCNWQEVVQDRAQWRKICSEAKIHFGSQRQQMPPSITPLTIDPFIEVLEGQLVELPCSVEGVPTPRITWLQNGYPVAGSRKYVDQHGMRFVANSTDFGEYVCIANNNYGNASLNFTVNIWVAPYMDPPLRISKNILIDTDTILECNAIGFPIPTIIWQFNGEILMENSTDLSFNENGKLFITNASTKHEGQYECIAENIAGLAGKSFILNIYEPPMIVHDNYTQPYVATVLDTALTISCKATGKPVPYIVWSIDNHYLDTDMRFDIDADGTLTIKKPSEELSGVYTCMAKNSVGNATKTVNVEIYSLPKPVKDEGSQSVVTLVEGTNATVECPVQASRTDSIKWYKEAVLISNGSLRFASVSRANASAYACVASNAVGSAHATLQLRVQWPPALNERGPQDLEAVKGDDLYLDCNADANPRAKTRWLFNSMLMLGEDKSRLRLMNVQLRHTGVYKCVVANEHGTVVKEFGLDVLVPPSISEFDLLDVQLKVGTNATLECNAQGSPKPVINWTLNNTNWHVQNSTVSSTNVIAESEGLYRCDATNKAGTTHLVYRVKVVMPAKVQEVILFNGSVGNTIIQRVEVVLDSRIRLACKASGKPTPTIQWIRHGVNVSQNDPNISYVDFIIEAVASSDAGLYSCIATNEGGTDERNIYLDVLEPPRIFQTLYETDTSNDVINVVIISGQAFYLHCHPYGNPVPEVYWFKDDTPLRLFDNTMVTSEFGEVVQSPAAMLEQSGNYTCVTRNKVGEASLVYLVDVLVPPPQPKESIKKVNIRIGKPLILTCPVEGSPQPYVTWVKHPYIEISEDMPRVQLLNDNVTLVLEDTETADSGKYSCTMTNKVGTTEMTFDVVIEKAPSITGNKGNTTPEEHVVAFRRSVVLKCEVEGYPPPKISWLKDIQRVSDRQVHIEDVTGGSLMAVWSVATRDAGQYICVAENEAGTASKRYKVVVKVPGKWSSWGAWSFCNVTCGLGYQQRSRLCRYIDDQNNTIDKATSSDTIILDESTCKGSAVDRRKCHMPSCEEEESQPRWSSWSRWSQCSTSCGIGTQARTRRCRSRTRCVGDNVQIRKCLDLPRCNTDKGRASNEVYNSRENSMPMNNYLPEATFEMPPEDTDNRRSSDFEDIYIPAVENSRIPEAKQATFFEVTVTENLDHSERGSCAAGFRHNRTRDYCDDIDECAIESNECHATQICVNTAGRYRCGCQRGYVSLGVGQRCLDVNECEQEIHGCEYACVNVAGGYVCACPRHLRLHIDRHHCVLPHLYKKPMTFEKDLNSEEYLSTAFEFPVRHSKRTRNQSYGSK